MGNFYALDQKTKGLSSSQLVVNSSGDILLVNDSESLDVGGDGYRWINRDSGLTFKEAWKQFTIEQDYKVPENNYGNFVSKESDFLALDSEGRRTTKYDIVKDGWDMATMPYVYAANDFTAFTIRASEDYYVEAEIIDVLSTSAQDLFIDITVTPSYINTGITTGTEPLDVNADVLLVGTSSTKILTSTGWDDYVAQEKQLSFTNLTKDAEVTLSAISNEIPIDGTIYIRIWGATANTGLPRLVVSGYSARVRAYAEINNLVDITASINENNNYTPDTQELEIGEVPVYENAKLTYYGGIFDSSGVPLTDWYRSCCPTSIYPLLEVVARGYNTQYKQSSWQINGSIIWDFDLFTSIVEDGHVMMINSLDWSMYNDEASAEFIEVFEYDDSIDIIEESQITDGNSRDFFQVNDNVDFLAFTIDAGAPKRISSLATENDATNSYIIVDDPSKTESKRISWSGFITALENALDSFLRKDQNLADLDDTSTARDNLDVYSKAESESRYVNIDGDETINDNKSFSELVGLVKGWVISTFTSGFGGSNARLYKDAQGKVELEVDRIKVREVFTAYETQIGQIRGIDGDLIVSSSEKAETVEEEELFILIDDTTELYADTNINLEI
jgi:hypothetical protein